MIQANTALQLQIKKLVWAYFFLLVFEGALRKWIAPSLSDAILIIRDPVVLGIYYLSYRNGTFPRNGFLLWGGILAFLSLMAGMLAPGNTFIVAIYGFRSDFLHWPLVFIVPSAFDAADIKRVGFWTLMLAIPLAALMVLQYLAPIDSWLNTGAGGEGGQIASAGSHIRAAATFSFISGPMYYYALVAAFLYHSQLRSGQYPLWLTLLACLACICAITVSGSRSLLLFVAIVTCCAFFAGTVLQPMLLFRWVWSACVIVVILFAVQDVPFIQQGRETFAQRIEGASNAEGGAAGFADRAVWGFTGVAPLLYDVPLLGAGLGAGTIVGSRLLSGRVQFLLQAEGEWARVLSESGPLLGGAFLIWRVYLSVWLGWLAVQRAARGDALPLLLFGVCGIGIVNGQFGQATTQGFVTFTAALCLAATKCSAPALQRGRKKRTHSSRYPSPRWPQYT